MKLKEKLAILILSIVITLMGFNLIASQSVDLLKAGKVANIKIPLLIC
ncbi:MAG: hypothetical protein ACETWK_08015 [Candidatus Aminicenantaceae bacterium]